MPELPEVETVRRGLSRVTLYKPVRGGNVLLERSIAHPVSVTDFLAAIMGAEITTWQRRGKYLLAVLARQNQPAGWLGCHLRMTGQLLWVEQSMPVSSHCRVRLFFDNDRELRYVDQRTFGRLWWVPPASPPETVMTGLQRLGPEPFADQFSLSYMQTWFARRQRPVKNALLDQAMVAGIGNIYADEALFLSGIRPKVRCDRISQLRLKRLHTSIRKVLNDSIEAGGTTFSDFRDIHGTNGNYGGVAWVYDREDEPCRVCSTPIKRIKLAGRSAHYCPNCQK
ncbi:DNA-formamidopyrimidine glycosylase [Leptothoe spongobia]|uniref:Formamidopyrimidine-DNA glycosylase n=1 Tax=Leptothoe spongobia TAU-MAC 1115 TaxID=1967444 RepID=A0A947DAB1_9CYAN|nr:DNA-formamidopyrimidine glycosylase [Leptothoe spongobia]MBT9313835.1 DNA-formamidopyrimidine glycosylase [Leptothoe spongobia TAU-MAC 1115]